VDGHDSSITMAQCTRSFVNDQDHGFGEPSKTERAAFA